MDKRVIRIFMAVCLMLAMTTTTAFAASTEMVSDFNTVQVKSSLNGIQKSVRRHVDIDGQRLSIKSYVSYYKLYDPYLKQYVITDVYVQLDGPMADRCSFKTFDYGFGVGSASTDIYKDGELIAMLSYRINSQGKLKCKMKKYI